VRRSVQHLLTTGLAILLALALAELISRVLPRPPEPPVKIYDARTGFRLRPGMRGTWTVENPGRFTINSLGFRDVEWTAARRAPRRVAVLGDSFAEALQVDDGQSFPKLVEQRLRDTEVMDFGVNGQGQVEELLTYRTYVRPFRPDLVVLAFFPGNDCLDNWRRSRPSLKFPVWVAPAPDGVTIVPNPRAGRLGWLRGLLDAAVYRSSLLQRLQDARKAAFRRASARGGIGEAGLWEGAFGNPAGTVADFDAMWSLTERLVLQLSREVAADTGRPDGLLVVCLTEAVQVHGAQRERFLSEHPGLDPDYAERRLRDFCAANGIPFLALSPQMRLFNEATGRFLHGFGGSGDGHYNQDGHRVAADAIAGRLRTMLP
jgi:hypothetical protein